MFTQYLTVPWVQRWIWQCSMVVNPSSSDGYIIDQVTVTATAKNVGGLDYTDGGTFEIVYLDTGNPISLVQSP